MTDQDIRQRVIDELDFDPSFDANEIGVAVENGVVTLTGHVSSYAQKLAVEKAARNVKGVRGIAQEIKVRLLGDAATDDDQLVQRALSLLDLNSELPRDAILVKAQDGWLTLTGNVDWQYQRATAESAVRRLRGVVGVTNLVTISPQVAAADVRNKILEALRRNAEIESTGIKVVVKNDKVVLEGRIKAWNERAIAERAAWSVRGVRSVDDHLTLA